MVRSRAFNEDVVLTGAMKAFRRSGYAGIAIPALEAATGISVGSIYNSYDDKHKIFLTASRTLPQGRTRHPAGPTLHLRSRD